MTLATLLPERSYYLALTIATRFLTASNGLQNKAARLIYLQPMRADATPLLQELHWLPVKQRIAFKTCTIMYKSLTNISPQYISQSLDLSSPRREGLRSKHNLNVPRTYKRDGDRAFSVAGPKIWNTLPTHIKNSPSMDRFGRLLKTHLFLY